MVSVRMGFSYFSESLKFLLLNWPIFNSDVIQYLPSRAVKHYWKMITLDPLFRINMEFQQASSRERKKQVALSRLECDPKEHLLPVKLCAIIQLPTKHPRPQDNPPSAQFHWGKCAILWSPFLSEAAHPIN